VADALGLVAGTVSATPLKYSVSLAPGQYAQLDDVVVTQSALPGRGDIQIAGVVTNVEAMHEGARFASDVFLIEQGALPAEVSEVAEVTVTRVEPQMYVPPLPGAAVTRAAGAQRDSALYFDEMGSSKVPVGFARDGQPVYVNFEFVDGTRGAHVSISGVSGIATKTSFRSAVTSVRRDHNRDGVYGPNLHPADLDRSHATSLRVDRAGCGIYRPRIQHPVERA
jgi:DNA helicase HerA-like ATPase